MGMYTEIFFRAELDKYAYDAIVAMEAAPIGYGFVAPDDDPLLVEFVLCERWPHLFGGGSAYFPSGNHFIHGVEDWGSGEAGAERYVSFRANLKNYNQEIQKFFAWVAPHVLRDVRTFIGYSLYEVDVEPTLYYAGD